MKTIKELFLETIGQGLEAAESITNAYEKATAYARLASAMAPLVEKGRVSSTDEPKGKESLTKGNNNNKAKTKGKKDKGNMTPVVKENAPELTPFTEPVAAEEEQVAPVEVEEITEALSEETIEEAVETMTEEAIEEETTQEVEAVVAETVEEITEEVVEETAEQTNMSLAEEFGYLGEEVVEMLEKDEELTQALRFYNDLQAANPRETLDYFVRLWTADENTSLDDISFDNLKGFIAFMYTQIEE